MAFTSQLTTSVLQVEGRNTEGGVVEIVPGARLLLDVGVDSVEGGALLDDIAAAVVEAQAARDQAVDISNISTTDAAVRAGFEVPGSQSGAYLAATYAPVTNPRRFGAVVDGTTDDTAAVQAALQAIYDAGGGTLLIDGHCRVDGQLLIPHDNAAQFPQGRSLRITGLDGGATAQNDAGVSKSILDLRYSGSGAKIVALGQGQFEIDHLTLADNGNSTTPFVLTTQATPVFHHMTVQGNRSKGGTLNDQDAFVLGGTTTAYDNTQASGFAGYGGMISTVRFDYIRHAVTMRVWVNGITVDRCWINASCGSNLADDAPFLIDTGDVSGAFARGNSFRENTIQLGNGTENRYAYGIKQVGIGADHSKFLYNDTWDFVPGIGGDIYTESGGNYIVLGLGTNTVVEDLPGSNRIIDHATAQLSGGWQFENADGATTVPLVVRRAATQPVNMFEVQNAAGQAQWRWTPGGSLRNDANMGDEVPLWVANDSWGAPSGWFVNAKGFGVRLGDPEQQAAISLTDGAGAQRASIYAEPIDPTGIRAAKPGSIFLRTDGTPGLYFKGGTASDATGWIKLTP